MAESLSFVSAGRVDIEDSGDGGDGIARSHSPKKNSSFFCRHENFSLLSIFFNKSGNKLEDRVGSWERPIRFAVKKSQQVISLEKRQEKLKCLLHNE